MGKARSGAKSGAACGLRRRERASVGDRAVLVGGFLIFLLTGFYGAEPTEATQREAATAAMVVHEPLRSAAPAVSHAVHIGAIGASTESAAGERGSVRRVNCAACR